MKHEGKITVRVVRTGDSAPKLLNLPDRPIDGALDPSLDSIDDIADRLFCQVEEFDHERGYIAHQTPQKGLKHAMTVSVGGVTIVSVACAPTPRFAVDILILSSEMQGAMRTLSTLI